MASAQRRVMCAEGATGEAGVAAVQSAWTSAARAKRWRSRTAWTTYVFLGRDHPPAAAALLRGGGGGGGGGGKRKGAATLSAAAKAQLRARYGDAYEEDLAL